MILGGFGEPFWEPGTTFGHLFGDVFFFRSDFPLHFFHCQAATAATGGGGREPRAGLISLDSGKLVRHSKRRASVLD